MLYNIVTQTSYKTILFQNHSVAVNNFWLSVMNSSEGLQDNILPINDKMNASVQGSSK